ETVYTRPAPQVPPRKPWTREEVEACERAGLWEGQHYELVEGELINKMGKKKPHMAGVRRVTHALEQVFRWELVYSEGSIDVAPEDNSTNEPEPDVMVLKRPLAEIQGDRPQPSDIDLAVEVCD